MFYTPNWKATDSHPKWDLQSISKGHDAYRNECTVTIYLGVYFAARDKSQSAGYSTHIVVNHVTIDFY